MLSSISISLVVLTTAMSASVIPSTLTSVIASTANTRNELSTAASAPVTSKQEILPGVIRAFDKIDVSRFARNPISSYGVKKGKIESGGVLLLKNVEFGVTGASKVMVGVNLEEDVQEKLEFRIDSENGEVISTVPLSKAGSQSTQVLNSTVVPVKGYHDLYVFYSGEVRASNISWFQFEVSGPNPEEFYALTSMWNGQAMSANTLNSVVNEHARIYPYSYGLHQMFSFVKTTLGSYLIKARHSGMYLEVYKQLFNETIQIVVNNRNATTQAQEWYIDPAGQGSVKIMSRLSGRCVTIHTGNSHLYQKSCLNETYQKWFLMPVC